ncbi:MAG: 3-deoxy-D-manno-octulosonic acid transferase [Candidatus Cloacimonetes bacterium]|nr:3-deoxy-D-manno-octulosonic acid transferase [Candidatus Cloacimonadota bacterium]
MFFYIFISTILGLPVIIYVLFRFSGKERRERLGFFKFHIRKTIWIHAASVGEVNAVKPLILRLLEENIPMDLVLSTMTSTGREAARKVSDRIEVVYFPIDLQLIMVRAFRMISPGMIILVETELWPVFLTEAARKKVPVLIVNGRISDKSFPGYRRFLFFWKPLFRTIAAVCAQSAEDAGRFRELGFKQVENCRNLKFSVTLPEYDQITVKKETGFTEDDFLLVWGSSRPGEEKLLREVFAGLKKKISNLKAILVPRHLSRLSEILQIYQGCNFRLYSEPVKQVDILIVDQMGQLTKFYAIADITIIGGSFFGHGGHNPLEPAYYGKPIIMGKDHDSCRLSVNKLLENSGIIITEVRYLESAISELSTDSDKRTAMGSNAKKTLENEAGSLEVTLTMIRDFLISLERED